MQDLKGLTISNFENKANIILGKVEVDKDGLGNFVELLDVKDFNIQSNIVNIFQNTCAISFNITLLNTGDRYSLHDTGASYYGYIKEGRKIRLYLGARLKPGEGELADYHWSWVYGIIDKPDMTYNDAEEICNIRGRDQIAYLSETYLKKLWWGKNKKYNIVENQEKYSMESDCTGIYRVFIDRTGTGTEFKETTLNSEWTYDWGTNELVFLIPSVPDFNGNGCLWVYYHTAQNVEDIVADLLSEAGILNLSERYAWLNNTDLCTPTGKTVERPWFYSGTSYIKAINMLTEISIYRFYIDGEGNPCFKKIPLLSTTIKRIDDTEYLIKKTEERLDELYNHFIIIGEKRIMKKMNLSVIAYTALYNLGTTSGELRGAILDDGGSTLTKKGFRWQKGEETEQEWYTAGSAIGYYTHVIESLTPDSGYKFYAFGENVDGDKKSSPYVYFRTLPEE